MAQTATEENRTHAPDVEHVIEKLNAAVAAEMQAANRYLFYSQWVAGDMSRELGEMYEEMATHEFGHAKTFMNRVVQLGGTPVSDPREWRDVSYAEANPVPEDPTDTRAILEDTLNDEEGAIRFYKKLADETRESDPVTWHIAVEALADEEDDRAMVRKLLREGRS